MAERMSVCSMQNSTAVQVVVDGVLAAGTTLQGRIVNGAEKTSTDCLHCFPATTAAVTLWVRFRYVNTQMHSKRMNIRWIKDKRSIENCEKWHYIYACLPLNKKINIKVKIHFYIMLSIIASKMILFG